MGNGDQKARSLPPSQAPTNPQPNKISDNQPSCPAAFCATTSSAIPRAPLRAPPRAAPRHGSPRALSPPPAPRTAQAPPPARRVWLSPRAARPRMMRAPNQHANEANGKCQRSRVHPRAKSHQGPQNKVSQASTSQAAIGNEPVQKTKRDVPRGKLRNSSG